MGKKEEKISGQIMTEPVYCLLTYTFDGDEAIVAPKEEVKKICEKCDLFEICEWETSDCMEKYVEAVNSIGSSIKYVETK